MYVKKRISMLLFAVLSMVVLTACGRWDYSREAVKAANDAQGETLRVEFKVSQALTDALRGAVADNIQPADVEKAITMDKTAEKLLTSGYRLDVYALRADVEADQAAEQLAGEFIARLAGCEDEGFISMVKADSGYFYEAVLTYKHSSGSDSSSDEADGSGEPEKPTGPAVVWDNNTKTLTLHPGASAEMDATVLNESNVKAALEKQGEEALDGFDFNNIEKLVIESGSGITEIAYNAAYKAKSLKHVELSGINKIGPSAFDNCGALETVYLTDVAEIWDNAFNNCRKLADVRLDGVKNIGNNAFFACYALTEIRLPDITCIEGDAFRACCNLTEVYIGDNLQKIYCAFTDTPIDYNNFDNKRPLNIHYGDSDDAFVNAVLQDKTIVIYGIYDVPRDPQTVENLCILLGTSRGRTEIVFLPYSSST